jgi:hypothetical protein
MVRGAPNRRSCIAARAPPRSHTAPWQCGTCASFLPQRAAELWCRGKALIGRHKHCDWGSTLLAPEPIDLRPVIAGKYELLRPLGQGSMGEVWLARHRTLREEVAIKLLKRPPWGESFEAPSASSARFRLEAQVAARLSRKTRHIVRVTDHGEERGLAYLVMELVEGMTLETRLMRRGSMSPEDVSNLLSQLGRALACAHAAGVVHRDLKPANVFLTVDEEGEVLAKVFDFGIACLTPSHRLHTRLVTGEGVLLGTPGYMSPEQAAGRLPLDSQCDLWALATIAYEALTGDLPVEGVDAEELLKNLGARRIIALRERRNDLGGALEAFFERAFAEAVEDRFPSVVEMVRAFKTAASNASELCAQASVDARCDEPPAWAALAMVEEAREPAPVAATVAKGQESLAPSPAIAPAKKRRTRSARRLRSRAAAACLLVASAVAAACGLVERAPASAWGHLPSHAMSNPSMQEALR